MEAVFLSLLNISITASYLVLAIVILRLILKKAPRAIICFLWALVGIRLVCPFSFESVLSLIPSAETVPQNIVHSESPAIQSGIPSLNSAVNPIISENFTPSVESTVNPIQTIVSIASIVWIAGIIAMIAYALSSYLLTREKVREAVILRDNIMICDHIPTPFILGIFRPLIFLPSSISEADTKFVVAHEKAHLKRRDHIWKILGYILLTLYWFNPILWLAYCLLCKDIELACDEKVITLLGTENKKPYAEALVNCSLPRKAVSACPLAFGEVGVKSRIKSVLNYKKPTFWVVITALIVCILVAICFLTNPPPATGDFDDSESNPSYLGDVSCYSKTYSTWVDLSKEDSDSIKDLMNDRVWKESVTKTEYQYIFKTETATIRYAQGGVLNDLTNNVHAFLSDTEVEFINSVIQKYDFIQFPSDAQDPLFFNAMYDNIVFDIDNDGKEEICCLGDVYLSSSIKLTLSVWEKSSDKIEYYEIFHASPMFFSFTVEDGRLRIQGETREAEPTIHYFDIDIKDGRIVLLENGKELSRAHRKQ